MDHIQAITAAATIAAWCIYFLFHPSTKRAHYWGSGILLALYVTNRFIFKASPVTEYINLNLAVLFTHQLAVLLVPRRMRFEGRSYHNFGVKSYWTIFLLLFSIPMGKVSAGTYLRVPAHQVLFAGIAIFGILLVTLTYTFKKIVSSPLEFECVRAGLKNSLVWDFIGAFCEELIFRGLLLFSLASIFPFPAAIILQAILFSLAHVKYGRPQGMNGFIEATAWGLALGYLVHVSGSLLPAFLVHAMVIPFLKPFFVHLMKVMKPKGSNEVRLFRCFYHGRMYLCDGEIVRIDLDRVANEILNDYERDARLEDVAARMGKRFNCKDIESAFREIKTLEYKGAILEPWRIYRAHPPCMGKTGTGTPWRGRAPDEEGDCSPAEIENGRRKEIMGADVTG